MKKLFLAVALVAASMTASAADQTWTFDGTETITTGVTTPTLLKSDLYYTDGAGKTVIDASSKTWSTGAYTMRYKTGGGGAVDGSGSALVINVTGNSVIEFCALASSSAAIRKLEISTSTGTVVGSVLVVGSNPAATDAPQSITYTGGAAQLYIYSAPTDPNDASYTAGGLNFYMLKATNVTASSKDAISSDLLKLKGEVLENTSNLSVEIYSITGVKVLTSSETAINVSGLSGAFVAKTAEGTLKFVK